MLGSGQKMVREPLGWPCLVSPAAREGPALRVGLGARRLVRVPLVEWASWEGCLPHQG